MSPCRGTEGCLDSTPQTWSRSCATSWIAADVPPSKASAVAESLIAADLRRHGLHGSLRVPLYVDRTMADGLEPGADPVVSERMATTAHISGNRTSVQVVGRRAVNLLTERAKGGVATVGTRTRPTWAAPASVPNGSPTMATSSPPL